MDLGLPGLSDFTVEQQQQKLDVHPDDRKLLRLFQMPLGAIIESLHEWRRTPPQDEHEYPSNWNFHYDGYQVWGIPEYMEDDEFWRSRGEQVMSGQFWSHEYPVSPHSS